MRSTKYHLVSITLVSCVFSGLSDGFQLHLLCEAQNCVVTGGATAFNYTCSAKHRIALSLVKQRLSITLVLRSTELRCHWWSNSFQLHLLCETQNCVVTGGATAFNYTCCAKHRIALSLVEQRLSITLVVWNTELRCHWWSNSFQLHLCKAQNCVVTVGSTAFNYTCCAKHRIALSLVEQRLSIVAQSNATRPHAWATASSVCRRKDAILVLNRVVTWSKCSRKISSTKKVAGLNWNYNARCIAHDTVQGCNIYILHNLTQCKGLPCRILHNLT